MVDTTINRKLAEKLIEIEKDKDFLFALSVLCKMIQNDNR